MTRPTLPVLDEDRWDQTLLPVLQDAQDSLDAHDATIESQGESITSQGDRLDIVEPDLAQAQADIVAHEGRLDAAEAGLESVGSIVNSDDQSITLEDLAVTRDDGNSGQRMSLTGTDDTVMPYFQIVASTRTGSDGGHAVGGFQVHLGPDAGSGANREFWYLEAVGDLSPDGPHFRMGVWASGTGSYLPFLVRNGGVSAIKFVPSRTLMEVYQPFEFSAQNNTPLRMAYSDGGAGTLFRAVTYGNNSQGFFLRRNGTPASPSAPVSGNILGALGFGSYDTTSRIGGQIRAIAIEDWALGSEHGTRLELLVTPINSASQQIAADVQWPGSSTYVALRVAVNRSGAITAGNQVTIGDADSGGSGYRVLRVPN